MSESQAGNTLFWIGIVCCCGAQASVRIFGWWFTFVVASWVFPFVFFFASCVAYRYAPALTRNALAVMFAFVAVGSLLVCGIQNAREQSRRMSCSRNLMELGLNLQNQQQLTPESKAPGSAVDKSWLEYYRIDSVSDARP